MVHQLLPDAPSEEEKRVTCSHDSGICKVFCEDGSQPGQCLLRTWRDRQEVSGHLHTHLLSPVEEENPGGEPGSSSMLLTGLK